MKSLVFIFVFTFSKKSFPSFLIIWCLQIYQIKYIIVYYYIYENYKTILIRIVGLNVLFMKIATFLDVDVPKLWYKSARYSFLILFSIFGTKWVSCENKISNIWYLCHVLSLFRFSFWPSHWLFTEQICKISCIH